MQYAICVRARAAAFAFGIHIRHSFVPTCKRSSLIAYCFVFVFVITWTVYHDPGSLSALKLQIELPYPFKYISTLAPSPSRLKTDLHFY